MTEPPSVDASGIPHSKVHERSVLGSCIQEGEVWWNRVINIADGDPLSLFHDSSLRHVADAAQRAVAAGHRLSYLTVEDQLRARGIENLSGIEVAPYVRQLTAEMGVTTVTGLDSAVEVLVSNRALRNMLRETEDIGNKIRAGGSDPNDIATDLRAASLQQSSTHGKIPLFAEVIEEMEEKPEASWYVPTGLDELDSKLQGGWAPGRMYILAARPKMGKSTLMLNSVLEALNRDAVVLVISMEMSRTEIYSKLISAIAGVPTSVVEKLINGKLTRASIDAADLEQIDKAIAFIKRSKLHVAFSGDVRGGSNSVVSAMMNLRTMYGPDTHIVTFIDYIGLLATDSFNRTAEVSAMSRAFKLAAGDQNMPVVLLSQINREGAGGMPRTYMLRDSGSLEQDANAVLLMYRPREEDPDAPDHIVQLNLEVNRNGPPGAFNAFWDGAIGLVMNENTEGVDD